MQKVKLLMGLLSESCVSSNTRGKPQWTGVPIPVKKKLEIMGLWFAVERVKAARSLLENRNSRVFWHLRIG